MEDMFRNIRSMSEGEYGGDDTHDGVGQGEEEDGAVKDVGLAQCPNAVCKVDLDRRSSTKESAG